MIRLLTPLRFNDQKQFYIYKRYMDMFINTDIEIIAIYTNCNRTINQLSNWCDGLLLSGGNDIDATYYKQPNHTNNTLEAHEIDEFEMLLLKEFNNKNKPIFGICRGIQTINVYYDGTLNQDVQNHRNVRHKILPLEGTRFYKTIEHPIYTNSYHHQTINQLGNGLSISAVSLDGHIEAIESKNIFACQWHPELDDGFLEVFIKIIKSFF